MFVSGSLIISDCSCDTRFLNKHFFLKFILFETIYTVIISKYMQCYSRKKTEGMRSSGINQNTKKKKIIKQLYLLLWVYNFVVITHIYIN